MRLKASWGHDLTRPFLLASPGPKTTEQAMPDDLKDKIKENTEGPASAEVDGQRVTQHNLKDQIEADRYLQSKQAMKKRLGIRLTKIVPPGAD